MVLVLSKKLNREFFRKFPKKKVNPKQFESFSKVEGEENMNFLFVCVYFVFFIFEESCMLVHAREGAQFVHVFFIIHNNQKLQDNDV